MALPLAELEDEVLSLAPEDRAHLLERLLQSFAPASELQDIERAWVAEALQREADVQAGRAKMVPGSEAMARVRARLA